MEQLQNDSFPVMKTLTEHNPPPIIDVVGGGVTYYGYAPLGTKTSDPKWKIMKVTVTGGLTISEFPDSKMTYEKVWDNRTTLTYSR